MNPDQSIRRGKIGGRLRALTGQLGNPSGWEEVCREVDITAGSPVSREGGQANSCTRTIFSGFKFAPAADLADTQPPPRVHLRIETSDGNDAGASKVVRRVLAGTPVTVSGSSVIVSAQIFLDEVGIVQAPDTVVVDVGVFIAEGEGEESVPTLWPRNLPDTGVPTPPLQSSGQIAIGPGKLKSFHGFSTSTTETWIMFFDWPGPNVPVPNGTEPLLTIHVDIGADFSDDYITSGRVFVWGLWWGASSTPDTLTLDGTQAIRMDPELFAEDFPADGIV